jgi:hypothetical protein
MSSEQVAALTFSWAFVQVCPKCGMPWWQHHLEHFAPVDIEGTTTSLEFTVRCPLTDNRRVVQADHG